MLGQQQESKQFSANRLVSQQFWTTNSALINETFHINDNSLCYIFELILIVIKVCPYIIVIKICKNIWSWLITLSNLSVFWEVLLWLEPSLICSMLTINWVLFKLITRLVPSITSNSWKWILKRHIECITGYNLISRLCVFWVITPIASTARSWTVKSSRQLSKTTNKLV